MPLNSSADSSNEPNIYTCPRIKERFLISVVMVTLKTILVLSLYTFILLHGFQRWRRSLKAASHSDIFTYNLAVNELLWAPGSVFYFCGLYWHNTSLVFLGLSGFNITYFGEMFFHLLSCVERYLAVVHPITYLALKNTRGALIRNASIACAWLLCFGLTTVFADETAKSLMVTMLCALLVSIAAMTFCTTAVLCVLIRPGPGEHRGREVKAFHSIVAMSAVLWLWFVGLLVCYALSVSSVLPHNIDCLVRGITFLFNLPTSLVCPLLYLHRMGHLPRCCHKTK